MLIKNKKIGPEEVIFTTMGNGASFSNGEVFDLDPEGTFGTAPTAGLLGRGCNRIGGCVIPGAVYGRGAV